MAKDEAKALLTQLLKELQNMGTAVDNAMEDQHIDTREKVRLLSQAVAGVVRCIQAFLEAPSDARREAIEVGTEAIVAWPEKLPPREAEPEGPKDVLGDPQKAEQAMRQRHPESREPTAEQRAAGEKPREGSPPGQPPAGSPPPGQPPEPSVQDRQPTAGVSPNVNPPPEERPEPSVQDSSPVDRSPFRH